MSPRSSLLKRVIVPLLAVTAAATLSVPARAAIVTWAVCKGQINTQQMTEQINEQVKCTLSGTPGESNWATDQMFNNRTDGGDNNTSPVNYTSGYSPGDFYDPGGSGYYYNIVKGGGTYDCSCTCHGGFYVGGTWATSTSSPTKVTI